ncbi:MAG: exopolysaccharide biosynthesis protein [Methanobacteriaceae archaeon]
MSETVKSSIFFSEVLSQISNGDFPDYIILEELLEITGNRGRFISCMILVTPFLIPVSIPGSSIPFGIAIMFIGMNIIFNRFLIPQRVLKYKIPRNTAINILKGSITVLKKFERVFKPRAQILTDKHSMNVINGILLVFSAFLLMLPLPIPLTDSLPAYSIFLLSASVIESDGYFIMISYVLIIITALYFGLMIYIGFEGVLIILSYFGLNL